MRKIKVGDHVEVPGDTQTYILKDPRKVYAGQVIGKQEGMLLLRMDKPVKSGTVEFSEVSVPETSARLTDSEE